MDNLDIRRNIFLQCGINDIKHLCLLDKLSLEICNKLDFWLNKFNYDKLDLFNNGNMKISVWIREYIKIELSDYYNITYNINNPLSFNREYFNVHCLSKCSYEQIKNILTISMYKKLDIQDCINVDYLFTGGSKYESNSLIVSKTLDYLNSTNDLLKLDNSAAKTIMIINEV